MFRLFSPIESLESQRCVFCPFHIVRHELTLLHTPRLFCCLSFFFFFFFFSVIYFHICPSSFVLFDCTAPFHFIARYFISSGKSFPLFYWFFFYFASYFYTFQIVSAHAAIKHNNNNNNSVGRNHLFGRHTVHLFCRLFDLLFPLSALIIMCGYHRQNVI